MEGTSSMKHPRPNASIATFVFTILFFCLLANQGLAMTVLLRLAGVQGSSNIPGHLDEIVLTSMFLQVKGSASGSRPDFADITFTKGFDRASPVLFLANAQGQHFSSAVIEFFNDPDKKGDIGSSLITIELSDVTVTNYSLTDNKNLNADSENVAVDYARIKFTDNVSGVSTCWDVSKNIRC